MDIAEKYIAHIQKTIDKNPKSAWKKMVLGYNLFHKKTKYFPKDYIAKGYTKLEEMMMGKVSEALKSSDNYIWTSIYVPSEIIQAAGLVPLSAEVLSAYMSHGYRLEKPLIDRAEAEGISTTLCSYHKSFLGAAIMDLIPPPSFCVATSLACDANLASLRYASELYNIPFYFIDVPDTDNSASVKYLAAQLEELVMKIEEHTGRNFDIKEFRKQVYRSYETNQMMKEFYNYASERFYPGELIHKMYMMMAVNIAGGSEEFKDLIEYMLEEIKEAPLYDGKKIMWVHVVPFYHDFLKEKFDAGKDYQLMVSDIALDYIGDADPSNPYEYLAKKMIGHAFNGGMDNKKKVLSEIIDRYQPDGIINFCQWGCKQAFGGSGILKEFAKEKGIPFLNLDGDGIDERNSGGGQVKTRVEAFLEMVRGEEK